MHLCSSSPPPYYDPERQRLLAGSSNHAVYWGEVPPEGPRPDKRGSRNSGPDQESRSDDYRSHSRCPIWVIILLLSLAGLIGFYSGRPSDAVRNNIRERWEVERQNHENELEKWYKDRDARRTQHTEEIQRFQKEEQDLLDRKQEIIADYNHTEHELTAKKRKMIDDYTHKEDMYRNKEQAWRQKIAGFEEEWQRMLEEENRKRERARLYWADIKGDEHCLSNGRKKYTATLANLTPSLDAMEACKFTPITLNGITYDRPISCENTGSHGIRGHWVANNVGVCAAYWEFVKVKDCTAPGSGYRRFEAKLGVIHAGENPEILCLTTPLYVNGEMYSRPMACPDWGVHGYWGIWNVPDDQCK